MYTNNYYWFKYYMDYVYCSNVASYDTNANLPNIKNTSGNDVQDILVRAYTDYYGTPMNIIKNNHFIYSRINGEVTFSVGTSDVAEDPTQYELVEKNTNVSVSWQVEIPTYNAGNYTRLLGFKLTNNGTDTITVKELGMYKKLWRRSTYSDDYCEVFLFNRTVLDTPVTLKVGDSEMIFIKITENNVT